MRTSTRSKGATAFITAMRHRGRLPTWQWWERSGYPEFRVQQGRRMGRLKLRWKKAAMK